MLVDYDNGALDATESTCVDGQTIAWWKLADACNSAST